MISTLSLFPILMACLIAWFLCGLATHTWGNRLSRNGDWLSALPLLPWLVFSGIALVQLSDDHFVAKSWIKGWIGPKAEVGAITVGLTQDPFGLILSMVVALIVALYLLDHGLYVREKKPERSYSALAISGSGVALALIAATPWMVFCGQGVCILGGFFCLGSRWDLDDESGFSTRFAWGRSWGLIVAVIGLCLLACSRGAIDFARTQAFVPYAGLPLTDQLGAILLVSGLFVQLGSFPFMGELLSESSTLVPVRLLTVQIFPAWCVLAMLIRFDDELTQLGVFPLFGWVGLASAALCLASGLVQKSWRIGLSIATSAGFGLSLATLAFAGQRAATALMIAVGLGALAMASAGLELDQPVTKKNANPKPAPWSRIGSGIGASALAGVLGFASASGALQLALKLYEDPPVLVAFLFVLLLLGVLTWSIHWRIIRLPGGAPPRVVASAIPFLFGLLSLAVVWTGQASGGFFPGGEDQITHSLVELFFVAPASSHALSDSSAFVTVVSIQSAVLLIGLLIGYSTTGRKVDSWARLRESAPRFSGFLGSGYFIDRSLASLRANVVQAARGMEWFFGEALWGSWLPRLTETIVRKSAVGAARADALLSFGLATGLRNSVEAPAKVLQLIQSGDVRWYLFFAIGSGIALLVHFARY